MKDAGIHDSIMRRYGDLSDGNCGKRAKGSSLNLSDTSFFFIVLMAGIVLSLVLLAMEVVWSRYMQENKEGDAFKIVEWSRDKVALQPEYK
jgi:hypothetical protein